jgi:arylsulfatase A-like enzyme/Flp pilus assembly protein TadD
MDSQAVKQSAVKVASNIICIAFTACLLPHLACASKTTIPDEVSHVILISIDTCRADRLGAYGYSAETTPHIDALAQEAVLFENVTSPVPITLPAHSSLMTGMIPPAHGVRDNGTYRLHDTAVTLAEILKDYGYQTAGIIGSFVLSSYFGLDQGFDAYDDDFGEAEGDSFIERRGEDVSRLAVEWLDEHREGKQFLFLHYFDPHVSYRPPEPFRTRFAESPYDGEIAYADWCIGQVIEKLKSLGVYGSSLVVITADHGEALGEHGETTHAYFVYQSTVRVPLLIKPPGVHKNRRVVAAASLVDVMPTILDVLGVPAPQDLQGRSLSPHILRRKVEEPSRFLYFESLLATKYKCSPLVGLTNGRWKLIRTVKSELYDLTEDPNETRNLIDEVPGEARRLRARLESILGESSGTPGAESAVSVEASTRQRLRALGYLSEGEIVENLELDAGIEDPKDFLRDYIALKKAEALVDRRQYGEAKEICRDLLSRRPGLVQALSIMGGIYHAEGSLAKAVEIFREALRLRPGSAEDHLDLGLALAQLGRADESLAHLSEAVRLDPNSGAAHNNLGNVLASLGRGQAAIEHYQKALDINPTYADAHLNMSIALGMAGRIEEAMAHSRSALEIRPGWETAGKLMRRLEELQSVRQNRQ